MSSVTSTRPHPEAVTEFIREWIPEETRAYLILVHGIAEHSGRYERVGEQFADAGFHVRSFDLIGAGQSGGRRWHIEDWAQYHEQIEAHVSWAKDTGLPVVLMGHSMGGNLALGYALSDRVEPDLLILSTPAVDAKAAWQKVVAPVMARIAPRVSISTPVNVEELSRDPAVGEAYLADPLVILKATPKFGDEFLKSMKELQGSLQELDIPTLVTHGGSDKLVPPQVSAPLGELDVCERRLYPGLRHEVLNEPEGPEVVREMIDWIDRNL